MNRFELGWTFLLPCNFAGFLGRLRFLFFAFFFPSRQRGQSFQAFGMEVSVQHVLQVILKIPPLATQQTPDFRLREFLPLGLEQINQHAMAPVFHFLWIDLDTLGLDEGLQNQIPDQVLFHFAPELLFELLQGFALLLEVLFQVHLPLGQVTSNPLQALLEYGFQHGLRIADLALGNQGLQHLLPVLPVVLAAPVLFQIGTNALSQVLDRLVLGVFLHELVGDIRINGRLHFLDFDLVLEGVSPHALVLGIVGVGIG